MVNFHSRHNEQACIRAALGTGWNIDRKILCKEACKHDQQARRGRFSKKTPCASVKK
jgi:hypothetical protein